VRTIATVALLACGWLLGVELPAAQVTPAGGSVGPGVTGTLNGEITSGGQRLAFVNVLVAGTKVGIQSDAGGRFVLTGVPTGERRILFHGFRYRKLDSLLIVRPGANPPIRVELIDMFPPPKCQPCFWVPPFQGARALRHGAMVHDFVGEAWQARAEGRAATLVISSDPDPCQLQIHHYLGPSGSRARLSIVDSAGSTVHVFDRGEGRGGHHVVWDGVDHKSVRTPYGWYHVRLETRDDTLQLEFGRVRRPPIR